MNHIRILTDSPVQENFLGLGAVYHGFAPMADHAGRAYTPEQCEMEYDRARDLGVRVVRTYFRWEFVWDSDRHLWNWNSDKLAAFSQWANAMEQRGISIALNLCWWLPGDLTAPNSPFNTGDGYDRAAERYGEFASEAVHQLIEIRGHRNIRYLMMFTEPQYGTSPNQQYEYWSKAVSAAHRCLTRDHRRNLVQLVGPNEGSTTTSAMVKWAGIHAAEWIDIYSSHNYMDSARLEESDIGEGHFSCYQGCPTHCRTQQHVELKAHTDYRVSCRVKVKADFCKPMHGHILFGALDLEAGTPYFKCTEPCSRIHEDSVRLVDVSELDGTWQEFSFVFNSRERTDCWIGLFYDVYQEGSAGLFDAVSLKEVGSEIERLKNPGFEAFTDDWIHYGSSERGADPYYDWERWAKTGLQYVPERKPFWFDEYNWRGGLDNPDRGTEIAVAQAAFLNCGVQTSLLWTLFDQQWPDNHTTNDDGFVDGDHRWGLMPNLRRTTVPYPAYEAFRILANTLGGEGTKVWQGETDRMNLHAVCTEHPDGTVAVLVTNQFAGDSVTFAVDMGHLAHRTFRRYLYDPTTVSVGETIFPLTSDRQIDGTLTDTLSPNTFAVYVSERL